MTDTKARKELQNLINYYGYWSREVSDFNSRLPVVQAIRVNDHVNKKGNRR